MIVPRLFRHVSYTDEVSKLYLAVSEWIGEQELDPEENINVDVIPLDEAKEEFDAYLDGDKDSFFGFDIPDITMLSMTVFFRKPSLTLLRLGGCESNPEHLFII